MGCCGGSRKGRQRPTRAALLAGSVRVAVDYQGGRLALFSQRGPATGTKYYFAATLADYRQAVYAEDVDGLLAIRERDGSPRFALAEEGG